MTEHGHRDSCCAAPTHPAARHYNTCIITIEDVDSLTMTADTTTSWLVCKFLSEDLHGSGR